MALKAKMEAKAAKAAGDSKGQTTKPANGKE